MDNQNRLAFPYNDSIARLNRYTFNDQLFKGDHFAAFNWKINDARYSKDYERLKYIVANFPALISKVSADMLFSEPIAIECEDEKTQEFLELLLFNNDFNAQLYESALLNSRRGDDVFKIRIDTVDGKQQILLEETNPSTYFPHFNENNIRQEPEAHEFAWIIKINSDNYLRQDIYYLDHIESYVSLVEGSNGTFNVTKRLTEDEARVLLGDSEFKEYAETKIKKFLVEHIVNWKDGTTFFGYDDYADLLSEFYAVNNRISKIDNILDKHSDPILALPEGVLDENGEVKRDRFHMFEIPTGQGPNPIKPEYITWNANLESAFKEISQLIDFLYMFSETSPDVFGMGTGEISGRALKLKLLRTLGKIARKKLYYDNGIKHLLYTAQLLAKAWNIDIDGVRPGVKPEIPTIVWNDGLPEDEFEAAQIEQIRLTSGNTSVKDSIKRLDHLEEEEAEEKAEEIENKNKLPLPTPAVGNNPFEAMNAVANTGTQTTGERE